jgi:hypothetical protein
VQHLFDRRDAAAASRVAQVEPSGRLVRRNHQHAEDDQAAGDLQRKGGQDDRSDLAHLHCVQGRLAPPDVASMRVARWHT